MMPNGDCPLQAFSIGVHGLLALSASLGAPEQLRPARGADVPGLLVVDPLLGADLAPVRDRAHDDLLAHGHRELLDALARPVVALVATLVAPGGDARLYRADPAVGENFFAFRQASRAVDLLDGQVVDGRELLRELGVVVAGRVHDHATAAVQAAGGEPVGIGLHRRLLSIDAALVV